MKRILVLMLIAICVYAIYFDFTIGTLPKAEEKEVDAMDSDLKYAYVTVEPGDTVLSLIEEIGGFPSSMSIEEMINDFIDLNGILPEQIQPGVTYKIPVYSVEDS